MHCIEEGISFHIVGQGREEKGLIYAAMNLKNGKPDPKGPLAAYASWQDLLDEAESVPDGDAAKLIKLYRHPGFGAILDALNRGERREQDAQVILTTAHRSKGREWDVVIIDSDLDAPLEPTRAQIKKHRRFFLQDGKELRFDTREDIHLRYVAFTRGRKHLLVGCPNLFRWWSGETP
jgi:superfamily I DNA/RNA helicase